MDKGFWVVVSVFGFELKEFVDGAFLDQAFHFIEESEGRQRRVGVILRGVKQEDADLAGGCADASFVMEIVSGFFEQSVDVLSEEFGLFGVEALWDGGVVVETGFFERCEGSGEFADFVGEAFGVGASEAGHDGPESGEFGGVWGDVFGEIAFLELLVIDGLFDGVAEQVGDAQQLDAAFEGSELGDLFEAVEVLFVGGADHEQVEVEDDAVDGGAARFAGAEEVFEGFDGPLEQVGVFDDTAIGVDERAERFKEVEGGEGFGEGTEGVIGGDLADGSVDVHLGFDLDDGVSVALGDVEAFDLDMAQDLFKIAAVVGEQDVKDHAVASAEVAFAEVFGELEVFGEEALLFEFVKEAQAFGAR